MYMDHRVGMYWWYWSRVTLDVSSDRIGGRISSLDDPLIYLLCIIGSLGPSKNSKNIMCRFAYLARFAKPLYTYIKELIVGLSISNCHALFLLVLVSILIWDMYIIHCICSTLHGINTSTKIILKPTTTDFLTSIVYCGRPFNWKMHHMFLLVLIRYSVIL